MNNDIYESLEKVTVKRDVNCYKCSDGSVFERFHNAMQREYTIKYPFLRNGGIWSQCDFEQYTHWWWVKTAKELRVLCAYLGHKTGAWYTSIITDAEDADGYDYDDDDEEDEVFVPDWYSYRTVECSDGDGDWQEIIVASVRGLRQNLDKTLKSIEDKVAEITSKKCLFGSGDPSYYLNNWNDPRI